MKTVFISYSYKDKEFVRKLASDLTSYGIEPWIDEREIRVGDSLVAKISNGIREADHILVVLSEDSVRSKWVQQEIQLAFQRDPVGSKLVLIPVVLGKVEIPPFLRDIKYVDLSESYREGLDELVHAILKQLPAKKITPTQIINVGDLAKEVAKEVAQIMKVNPQGIREENGQNEKGDPKLVFVIISFTSDMDSIFEGIQAAGQIHGLRVERVKDVLGDYRITDKIIEMIHNARLIVADLTHEIPNVYFELGYARGLGKTIITTAREGTKLHFDVKDWTCTFYNDSRVLERHLRERFAFELGKK